MKKGIPQNKIYFINLIQKIDMVIKRMKGESIMQWQEGNKQHKNRMV